MNRPPSSLNNGGGDMNRPPSSLNMLLSRHTRRREFISLASAAVAIMIPPLPLNAQPSGKIWRIGVLETISMALNAPNFDAFRQSLRDLGYIEGKNLIIEYRSAEGRGERFVELTADLLRVNVDVIVTRGTPAVLAAKSATTTTPIVMAASGRTANGRLELGTSWWKYHRVEWL